MKNDFAVLIGINDYTPLEQFGLRTLSGAVADADDMEKWLTKKEGGNIPKENCFKIVSKPAPLKPIQDEIDTVLMDMIIKIKANGGKGRRLYFYFSGHGLGSMANATDTALCLANWSEYRRNSALSSEKYKDVIQQFGLFEEILFFADCCRNTKINITPMSPNFAAPRPDEATGNTRLFIAYATQYQDQSFEIEVGNSEKRGVFTKVLLDALNGKIANADGQISAERLKDYLEQVTPIEAQKQNYKQKPSVHNNLLGSKPLFEFPHLKNKKFKLKVVFDPSRTGKIEFIFPDGTILEIDPAIEKEKELLLAPGLPHLLRDSITLESLPIILSTSKETHHVKF